MTARNGNKTETIGHEHEKVHIKGGVANRTRKSQAASHDFGSLQEDNGIGSSVKSQLTSHQNEQQKVITAKSHINLL